MIRNSKVDAARVRRIAYRRGLILRKSRRRDPQAIDYGHWFLVNPVEQTSLRLPSLALAEAVLKLDRAQAKALIEPQEWPVFALSPTPGPVSSSHPTRRSRWARELKAMDDMEAAGYEPLHPFPG